MREEYNESRVAGRCVVKGSAKNHNYIERVFELVEKDNGVELHVNGHPVFDFLDGRSQVDVIRVRSEVRFTNETGYGTNGQVIYMDEGKTRPVGESPRCNHCGRL